MRLTEFMVVIIAALMFLIPTMKHEKTAFEREEQEATPMEELASDAPNTYKVTLEVKSPREEEIADILWMKKAAEIAQDAGIPYFNVVKQKTSKKFFPKYKKNLSKIDGVIQLDNDPMRAEYDASEIESLVLSDGI